ncbi:MAG: hypothetical protein R2706_11665 [Acidimicrobiales bacterium]
MKRSLISFSALLALLLAGCGSDSTSVDAGSGGTVDTTMVEPLGGGGYPIATLDITISHPEADDVSYTISCLGDTATVIGEVAIIDQNACSALSDPAVKTRLVDIPPTDQACTEQYGGPDVAHIVGTFDGEPVDTTIDRVNGCGIGDWDSLLASVLPPALGITDAG